MCRLIELHGGAVEAHSSGLGQGSEFVVRLAALPAGAGAEPVRPSVQALPPRARRVLVVDDNIDAADTLADLLRIWGHEVEVAYSGPGALEAAAGHHPDTILMDIGLPGLNGYEVARSLRSELKHRHTLLVALKGYAHDQDRRQSEDAGFDEQLVKPVDPAQLQRPLSLAG